MPLNEYTILKYQGFSCDLVLLALGHFVFGTRNIVLLGLWDCLGRNRNPGEPLNVHVIQKHNTLHWDRNSEAIEILHQHNKIVL